MSCSGGVSGCDELGGIYAFDGHRIPSVEVQVTVDTLLVSLGPLGSVRPVEGIDEVFEVGEVLNGARWAKVRTGTGLEIRAVFGR